MTAAAAWAKVPLQLIVSSFIREGLAPGKNATGPGPSLGGVLEGAAGPWRAGASRNFPAVGSGRVRSLCLGACKEEVGTADEAGEERTASSPCPPRLMPPGSGHLEEVVGVQWHHLGAI